MLLSINSGPDAGRSVEVSGDRFVIGRDEGCNLILSDSKASRNHAFLEVQPTGQVVLHDMGSTNGTFVNERRVDAPTPLFGGEQIRIGDTVLVPSAIPAAAPSTEPIPAEPSYAAATRADPIPAPPGVPPGVPVPPGAPPGGFGAPPVVPPVRQRRMGTATIERMVLRSSRAGKRAMILAGIAVLVAIAVVALFVTGILPPGSNPPTVTEIVSAIKPSTVQIIVTEKGGTAFGTGWVYDASKGLVVTNGHVVFGGKSFQVRVGSQTRDAKLVGEADCRDLAVLQVSNASGLKTLPLGSQSELHQGDRVVALGFPLNAATSGRPPNLVATDGVVSVVKTQFTAFGVGDRYPNVIQETATINPGNSGGPLVNEDEQLVGVNTLQFGGADFEKQINHVFADQFYAIGVDLVKDVVPKLAEGQNVC